VAAAEGRVVVDDHAEGAAFLVGPGVALTARHVIKTALDENDRHCAGCTVTVDFGGGVVWAAKVDKFDQAMDVAVLRGAAVEPARAYRCGAPVQGAGWRVSTKFLPNDPVLTGTITDPARTIQNAQGHDAELAQLYVQEGLGGFNGYSGSPVWMPGAGQVDRVAVGVLVEQTLLRVKNQPGQHTTMATNVLWAAPLPAVLAALGLDDEIQLIPAEDPSGVSWPVQVGLVPGVAAGYQERGIDLASRMLAAGSGMVTLVSTGLGGTGKTQLAAVHASRLFQAGQLDLLVWITARSRNAILTGLAAAAREVGLDVAGRDVEQAAAKTLSWLAATPRRWLIVFDDVDDPADLADLWPSGPAGTVLATTRRKDSALHGEGRVMIDIDAFTPAEAVAYLTRKLHLPPGGHEIAGLAEDLGRLPLALAQAAAYIADRGLTVPAYRRRFADRKRRLADLLPVDAAADGYSLTQADRSRATVAATWSLSIAAANTLPPVGVASRLLEFMSVLDPNRIPPDILHADPARSYLNEPPPTGGTGPGGFSTDDVNDGA